MSQDHAFIVLAAGEAKRFGGKIKKHLLSIDGVPLIKRLIDQFGPVVSIVTNDDELLHGVAKIVPERCENTCASLWSSRHQWGEKRTTILLGDVYFTDEAVDTIKDCDDAVAFFTGGRDLFAISFSPNMYYAMMDAAKKAADIGNNCGRLWEIYREINGGIHSFPIKPSDPNHKMLSFIGDRTQDFDAMREYREFLEGKTKNALLQRRQKREAER